MKIGIEFTAMPHLPIGAEDRPGHKGAWRYPQV